MFAAICKHLMTGEYTPFDRFVELGVFLLIAYEVVVPMIQRRLQRRNFYRLADLVEEAGKLRNSMPTVDDSNGQAIWSRKVNDWTDRAKGALRKYPHFTLTYFENESGVDIVAGTSYTNDFQLVARQFGN